MSDLGDLRPDESDRADGSAMPISKRGKRLLFNDRAVVVHLYSWWGFRPVVQAHVSGGCMRLCRRWWIWRYEAGGEEIPF